MGLGSRAAAAPGAWYQLTLPEHGCGWGAWEGASHLYWGQPWGRVVGFPGGRRALDSGQAGPGLWGEHLSQHGQSAVNFGGTQIEAGTGHSWPRPEPHAPGWEAEMGPDVYPSCPPPAPLGPSAAALTQEATALCGSAFDSKGEGWSILTFLGPDYNLGGDQGAGRSPPKRWEPEAGQGFEAQEALPARPPPRARHRGRRYRRVKRGPPTGHAQSPTGRGPSGLWPLLALRIPSSVLPRPCDGLGGPREPHRPAAGAGAGIHITFSGQAGPFLLPRLIPGFSAPGCSLGRMRRPQPATEL